MRRVMQRDLPADALSRASDQGDTPLKTKDIVHLTCSLFVACAALH
jgi:hypothetical protein